MITVSTAQLQKICENPATQSFLCLISGNPQTKAHKVTEPQSPGSLANCLCFANSLDLAHKALQNKVSILILDRKVDAAQLDIPENTSCFSTPSVTAAMVLVLPFFDQKMDRFPLGIHPTASIAKSAQIGKDVRIGAMAVIGEEAVIGDGCVIGAQTVVEYQAQVGAKTILHPQVFVGSRCIIGKSCELHPHSTIGADGFGFIKDPQGIQQKIPQVGIVVVEDFVEIGANTAIDRATLSETRIGEGSKFDNHCHVAHNCRIGKRNVFAGAFMMAGTSVIGDDCTFGGGTLVSDHVTVGSKIIVAGKSGVTKDVLEPGAYAGYPLQPLKDGLRTLANTMNLTEMRKDIAALKEALKESGIK